MIIVKFPVNILARCKSAQERVQQLAKRFNADAVDPLAYRCAGCGLEWECSPLDDYREVVCSGCYGERVMLTLLRLGFSNWGDHNGGEKEQRSRARSAKRAAASAGRGNKKGVE